ENNSAKVRTRSRPGEKIIPSPMTCTEEHEALKNGRRYQRYEIDTPLQVRLLGLEQRGTLRGRSLNFELFPPVAHPEVMLMLLSASFIANFPSAPGLFGSSTWSTSASV